MKAVVRSLTSAEVNGAAQISVTGSKCGGVAGCTMMQRSRQARSEAKCETGKLDVVLARIASGGAASFNAAKICVLLSSFSTMHSCTNSVPATAASSVSCRVIRASTSCTVSPSRSSEAELARLLSMRCSALSRNVSLRS